MHQKIDNIYSFLSDPDEDKFWHLGESFNIEDLQDVSSSKDETSDKKENKPQICKKCNEIYEFANANQADGTFICYSCRNY
jgi:formylmethanofuran dehydrogenase subunit E